MLKMDVYEYKWISCIKNKELALRAGSDICSFKYGSGIHLSKIRN